MKDSPPIGDEGFRFRPWSNRLRALPRPAEDELIDVQEGDAEAPEPEAAPEAAAPMTPAAHTEPPLPVAAMATAAEAPPVPSLPAAAPPPAVAPPAPSQDAVDSPAGFRLAAAESMKSALEMLRSYPGDYRDAIRTRSEERAADLRARAEQEMDMLAERAEAEIARVHQEAAFAAAARRTALDEEMSQEQSRRDAELLSTDADIAAFDSQLAAFQAQALEFLGRVTSAGSPSPAPTAAVVASPQPVPAAAPLPESAAAPEPPMADAAAPIAMPESMSQAAPSPEPEPEALAPDPEPEPEALAPDPDFDGTTVSVRGLTDIASIAAFMRPLSRTHGIESVQIRSAQNGEVTFAVVHGPDVEVDAAIRATPHFEIEILDARPRLLILRASERLAPPEGRPAD
jgi:hypothetical protein